MADDEEHDFQDEEEDDDEADFVPGMDEEDDDEDDDAFPMLDGNLFLDEDQKIHYKGHGFHLTSDQVVPWNLLDSKVKPKEQACHLIMNGPCDLESTGKGKPTPRKIEVTWTLEDSSSLNGGENQKITALSRKKGDESDEKNGGKMPTTYYRVFGQQIDAPEGDIIEFKGGYHPTDGKKLGLLCQARMTTSSNVAAGVAAARPAAAVASARTDKDDEDEDDLNEADGQVDYDELIALHEDAGLSVDALRKRYRGPTEGADESPPKKKAASKEDDDDDDDDDYGF